MTRCDSDRHRFVRAHAPDEMREHDRAGSLDGLAQVADHIVGRVDHDHRCSDCGHTTIPEWERIPKKGRLVYWRLRLPDRSYLTASKDPDGSWWWRHRGPEHVSREEDSKRPTRVNAAGTATSSTDARRKATLYIAEITAMVKTR